MSKPKTPRCKPVKGRTEAQIYYKARAGVARWWINKTGVPF